MITTLTVIFCDQCNEDQEPSCLDDDERGGATSLSLADAVAAGWLHVTDGSHGEGFEHICAVCVAEGGGPGDEPGDEDSDA